MANILIATDFSHHSKYAVKHVLNLVNDIQTSSRILLLNTYLVRSDSHTEDLIEKNDRTRKKSLSGLGEEKKIANEALENPKVSIDISSRMGSLKNVVLQLVQKEKFDFIVMGKDGGTNVQCISELLKKYKGPPLLVTYD